MFHAEHTLLRIPPSTVSMHCWVGPPLTLKAQGTPIAIVGKLTDMSVRNVNKLKQGKKCHSTTNLQQRLMTDRCGSYAYMKQHDMMYGTTNGRVSLLATQRWRDQQSWSAGLGHRLLTGCLLAQSHLYLLLQFAFCEGLASVYTNWSAAVVETP